MSWFGVTIIASLEIDQCKVMSNSLAINLFLIGNSFPLHQNFAGLCSALMIAFGAVGAVIAGVIADKTRKFAEVTKIGFVISILAGIAFVQLARYRFVHVSCYCTGLYMSLVSVQVCTCLLTLYRFVRPCLRTD